MNKKVLGTILSTGIILTAGAVLTACGSEGSTQPTKTISNVEFSVANQQYQTIYNQETNTFTFVKGTQINFSNDDFRVVVTYTDGTQEVFSSNDFTVDLSGIPSSNPDTGYYFITVSLNNSAFMQTFNINVVRQQIDDIVINDTMKFTYNNQPVNIVEKIDQAQTSAGKMTLTQLSNLGYVTISSEDELTNTNIGTYSLRVIANDGFEFAGGTTEYSVYWEIEKIKVPMPQVKVDGNIIPNTQQIKLEYKHQKNQNNEYVGVMQGVELVFDGFEDSLINEILTISGTTGTDASNYSIYINVKDEYKDIYTIDELGFDYSETFVRSWLITPMEIDRPTIENGDEYHYTYSGETITPQIDFNGLDDLFEVSGTTSSMYAGYGAYQISVRVKDEYSWYNYVYKNETSTSPVVFNYYIDKADSVLPEDIEENLIMETTYGTGEVYFKINNDYHQGHFTDDTINYLEENGLITGNEYFEWVESSPTIDHATAEGEYIEGQCTFTYDYNNCNASDPITVKIKVNKRKITIGNTYWEKGDNAYYYNGEAKTNALTDFTNLNPYVEGVSVASTTYYKKVGVEYQPVTSCVDVGEYKTVVSFNVPQNYELDDIETEWTIEKSELNIEINDLSWNGTALDKDVQYYNGNISLVEADGEEREVRTITFNPYVYAVNPSGWTAIPNAVSMTYTYYKWVDSNWTAITASQIKDVGKFKAVAALTYDTANFEINEETNPATAIIEFEILSRTIDCSTATWEAQTDFTYTGSFSGDYPQAILPKGTYASYHFHNQYGSQSWAYSAVGTYTVTAEISVIGNWADLVTLIHDDALSTGKEYNIVARELSESDFGWQIVKNYTNYSYPSGDGPVDVDNWGAERIDVEINSNFFGDVDVEYTTENRSANPNEYRTTAVITVKAGNQNVTISSGSITIYIDWNLKIQINSDISKVYDGNSVEVPQYSVHGQLPSNQYIMIEYKAAAADDDQYAELAPHEVGSYVVRVSIIEDNVVESHTVDYATKAFTIDAE